MAVRLSAARQAMRPRVPQPAMRGSGARRNTAARKRTVRTRASEEPRRAAPSTLDMFLPTLVAIVAIIGGTAAIIVPSIEKLTISNNASIEKLTISNNASINAINKELTANTASIKELKSEVNTKLDAIGGNVQAQQVKTAELQGQVTILREGPKKK